MSIEIERKFLVKSDMYKKEAFASRRMLQAYLCRDAERSVRVRISGDEAYLTIKGPRKTIFNSEWEYPVPVEDARAMLELCLESVIDKTRYYVRSADGVHTWEVDEFYGDNDGLCVAEIELGSEDEEFPLPCWVGKEVSEDSRYHNTLLSVNPYRNWKDEA